MSESDQPLVRNVGWLGGIVPVQHKDRQRLYSKR